MTGKTHFAFGVLLGTTYGMQNAHDLSTFAGIVGTTAVASLVPDICHHKSKTGKLIWPISWFVRLLFGHRTLTHSILFLSLVSAVLYFAHVNIPFIIAFNIGMLSHLVLDMLTPQGVTLFYPIEKKIRWPLHFKTGGIIDISLATTFSILTMYIFYQEMFHRIMNWLK